MNLMHFAFKNLTRYTKRTIITATSLGFGILCFVFVDSFLKGISEEALRNLRIYETGDALLADREYWDDYKKVTLTHIIEDPQPIMATLRQNDIAFTARIRGAAEAIVFKDPYPEDGSLGVQVLGVEPRGNAAVFEYGKVVAAGSWLSGGDETEVVLGGWLAEDLGAAVGFPITFTMRTRKGFRQTIDAIVVGIMNCPNPVINRRSALIDIKHLDEFLQMEGGRLRNCLSTAVTKKSSAGSRYWKTECRSCILKF